MTGALAIERPSAEIKSGVPIRINRVSKTFGEDGDTPFQALKEITVDIAAGEFISVVGASGCGKSTLMLMVAGLLARSHGDVVVGGTIVTRPITDVGIAFQDHLLLEFRTAFDNVMLQADIRRLPRKKMEARARELFGQLRLTHATGKYPRQLSGGMRQRVAIARALATDPQVMFLDEPLGALDALTRESLQGELARLCGEGDGRVTTVMITNSVDEAILLADRIVPILPGPPATLGAPIEVLLPRPRSASLLANDEAAARVRTHVITTLTAALSGTARTRRAASSMRQPDADSADITIPVAEETR